MYLHVNILHKLLHSWFHMKELVTSDLKFEPFLKKKTGSSVHVSA